MTASTLASIYTPSPHTVPVQLFDPQILLSFPSSPPCLPPLLMHIVLCSLPHYSSLVPACVTSVLGACILYTVTFNHSCWQC